MIDLINHLVMLDMYTVDPERILLLTPHCLQESSCVHKVHMMYTIVNNVVDASWKFIASC